MPTYYFNLNGSPSAAMTFNDIDHARREGLCYLAQVLREAPHAFWRDPILAMTVTDETGKILFTLRLVGTMLPADS